MAVATAMLPDATVEDAVANAMRFADGQGEMAGEFVGRMQKLMEIAANSPDVFALREPFYREFLVTFPPRNAFFALVMVPCALALCLIAHGDAEQAIIGAANLGRDCDTIAGVAGALSRALHGASAIPTAWVEKVVLLNPEPDLEQVAEDLSRLIVARTEEQQRRGGQLLSMV